MMEPVPADARKAVLELHWLPESPPAGQPAWEERPAAGGGTLRTPSEAFVRHAKQTVRGPVREIP
jgi:hypothetical protein